MKQCLTMPGVPVLRERREDLNNGCVMGVVRSATFGSRIARSVGRGGLLRVYQNTTFTPGLSRGEVEGLRKKKAGVAAEILTLPPTKRRSTTGARMTSFGSQKRVRIRHAKIPRQNVSAATQESDSAKGG